MKVALYARVSMGDRQNPDNQLIELRKWAKNCEYEIVGEFVDEMSTRKTRPQKEILLKMLRLGEINAVCFVALDRWGRNARELIGEFQEFNKPDKTLISLKEGLDFSSASGRMFGQMIAIFTEFERERIRERVHSGLERAKLEGRVGGRPRKYCKRCKKKLPVGKYEYCSNECEKVKK